MTISNYTFRCLVKMGNISRDAEMCCYTTLMYMLWGFIQYGQGKSWMESVISKPDVGSRRHQGLIGSWACIPKRTAVFNKFASPISDGSIVSICPKVGRVVEKPCCSLVLPVLGFCVCSSEKSCDSESPLSVLFIWVWNEPLKHSPEDSIRPKAFMSPVSTTTSR